eukprot:g6427.t1
MPTVSVVRDTLLEMIGCESMSEHEFDQMIFDFGVELDGVIEEAERFMEDEGLKVVYKIDVPANRYDLLCVEGLAAALRCYLGYSTDPLPFKAPVTEEVTMTVDPSTLAVRPYVVCAVLRDVTMTQRIYNSFIDLQDKLHQNIGRRRTLVAIGTHDMDKVEQNGFTYSAENPEDIVFIPLKQTETMDANGLMKFYEEDKAGLGQYLYIIRDKPQYPVIRDRN